MQLFIDSHSLFASGRIRLVNSKATKGAIFGFTLF